MFSSNRKISVRQARRLMILDLFGIGSLLLPGLLAKTAGTDGIFCIAAATLLAFGYLWLLGKVMDRTEGDYYTYLKRVCGSVFADILMMFYLFFFLLLAAFGVYQLTGLIRAWLLPEGSFGLICFLLLAVAAYAAVRGMEVRARIYEILFWILGLPLLLMLILAARGVNVDYWTPVAVTSFSGFSGGTLTVFAFFLPLFFIQFLKPWCARPERLSGSARWAVGITAVLIGAIYLILLGTFQVKTIEALKRPVITLMSMVKLPGEFFARLDAFMTAIWFFSLFALINTGVFYSGHVLKELFHEKKTNYGLLAVLILEFGIARWFYVYPQAESVFAMYIKYVAIPVLVLLPILLLLLSNRKKINVLLLVMASLLLFTGCSARELEDRGFPMAVGIDKEKDDIVITFDFPDLSESEKGESPSQRPLSFSVQGGAYYEAQKAYENNTNKVLDYSHLKAIVIGEALLADDQALRELLAFLEQEELLARNISLFATSGKAADILALTEETSGTMGKYLEQMVDAQKDFKENKVVTLGDLMNQWHNRNEVLLIPVLADNGNVPAITEYAVLAAFAYKGNISVEDSMKSFLCQNLLERFLYQLEDGTVFQLTDLRAAVRISSGNPGTAVQNGGEDPIVITIALTGDAQVQKAAKGDILTRGKLKKELDRQLEESMALTADRMKETPGMDIANSYIRLGGYARELYEQYQQDYEGYGEHIAYRFSVDMDVVNE